MNQLRLFFLFFFLYISIPLMAQIEEQKGETHESEKPSINDLRKKDSTNRFISLYKLSKPVRLDFEIGTKIHFKLKNDKRVTYSQYIQAIKDSSFFAQKSEIFYKDVYAIKVARHKPFLRMFRNQFCYIGGIAYFLIDLVNNRFKTTEETLMISGSFLAAGGGITFLIKPRTYKLNKHRYLKTMQKW